MFWVLAAAWPALVAGQTDPTEDKPEETAAVEKKEAGIGAGLMFVSRTDDPKVYSEVKGAKKTVLAPAHEWEYGVRLFTKTKWQEDKLDWNEFLRGATERADRIVDLLEPSFRRDNRGVIEYAEVRHKDPFLSSILLSKRLLPRFEREFGRRLNILILGRNRLLIFPADGGKLTEYGPLLARAFHDTNFQVTLEVFLVDETGFQVIGEIED